MIEFIVGRSYTFVKNGNTFKGVFNGTAFTNIAGHLPLSAVTKFNWELVG